MTFLTERKREVLGALAAGPLRAADIETRLEIPFYAVREELRDLRSLQLVRSIAEGKLMIWELTDRGRNKLVHDAQLALRGIEA